MIAEKLVSKREFDNPMDKHAVKVVLGNYRKHLCISRTILLKFWVKNRGCGLYTRQLLSEGVKGLVGVIN